MAIKLVLVGAGNMGFAMLSGWLKAGKIEPGETLVIEPNDALRDRAARLGCPVGTGADAVPQASEPELIILAVKPQVIREVAAGYARFGDGTTAFLSIAAGTPVKTFEDVLGADTPIIRCMPNTPAAIGKGMMVVFSNPKVTDEVNAVAADLLAANGEVATIDDESLMDAVTAVSGSGPAYIFHFIECLTAAAEQAGLPPAIARLSAMQTVYGAASLAAESREDPAELRRQVTSPNGTTYAALQVLMGEDRLKTLLGEAVEAARARSVELGK